VKLNRTLTWGKRKIKEARRNVSRDERASIPAIIERLADSVEWEYDGASNSVPWLQQRHGRAEAAKFFESLGTLEFHPVFAQDVAEGEGLVVMLVDLEAKVKQTGKPIVEEDEVRPGSEVVLTPEP
jgi:hypothetical protein